MTLPEGILSQILPILLRVLAAVAVLLVGRWLARASRPWAERAMAKSNFPPSLKILFVRILSFGILLLAVLVALMILGVPPMTVLGVLAIIVVILGLALQQSLSDLAATVWFFTFQPFKVGDLIETGGVLGTVQEIQLLSTVILKFDNKVAILPNNGIRSGAIVNYSTKDTLRADVTFSISYANDLIQAKRILDAVVAEDERIHKDPPPQVAVQELSDSGIILAVRPYVKQQDYWSVRTDLVERVKLRFDREGIALALPRREIHLVEHSSGSFGDRAT